MADIIRHQYQNDELVHKLRSMLNDLPTLRSRAVKKLKHWREAAIKRLLMKQKELEKTLLDKFERLEFDTQLFVEKIERKKSTTGSRRWNSEPLGYDNTKQIERISINLKSIREELEQSKLLLVDGIDPNSLDIVDKIHTMTMSQQLLTKQIQQQKNNSIINKHSSTTSGTRSYDIYELGSELKRVLDICTSPQSSTSLSADEIKYGFLPPKPSCIIHVSKKPNTTNNGKKSLKPLMISKVKQNHGVKQSPLQSLDNINNSEHLYDANIRRTTAIHEPFVQRDNQSHQQKRLVNGSHTSTDQRRDSQTLITNDSSLSSQPPPHSPPTQSSSSNSSINNANINNNNNCHKLFQIESFDDSIRRFQRLREIRKNLRTKYDDQQQINQISSNSIIDENIEPQFIEQKRSIPIPSSNERSKTQTINNFSSSAPSTYLINGVKTFTKDRKTIALDHLNEPLDINNNNNNKLMTSPTSQIRHTLLAREPISIPIERVQLMSGTTLNVDPDILELYDKATTTSMTNDSKFSKSKIPTSVKNYHNQAENSSSRKITSSDNNYDRRQRSKIVEKQIGIEETNKHDNYFSTHNHSHNDTSFDNQIYGCNTNDEQQQQHHRSTHTTNRKHRSESTNNTKTTTSNRHTNTNRLQIRRSSDDQDDNQKKIQRRHTDMGGGDGKILSRHLLSSWYAIDKEHWTNMLENGWRPTHDHQGVKQISYHNSDDSRHHNSPHQHRHNNSHRRTQSPDFYEKVSRFEYTNLFEQLEFTYQRTINLGNEFWRFLEISGDNQLCLYHQLSKQLILYKPDESLVSLVWPYDGIVDISYSKSMALWLIATQTQICLCNKTLTKILQSIDIIGDWPKRITTSHSSIFHTHKITPISQPSPTQFLLQRYDYKLNCLAKHILESSTIWDISTDDNTQHLAILCDVALLIFDYNLNLLRQIEVTGFKVSKDHFGGWLIADYNANCIWQIMRNDYLKPKKILNVERPWSVIFDRLNWRLVTLSETQNRAKRLLFFNMINIPNSLLSTTTITTS